MKIRMKNCWNGTDTGKPQVLEQKIFPVLICPRQTEHGQRQYRTNCEGVEIEDRNYLYCTAYKFLVLTSQRTKHASITEQMTNFKRGSNRLPL